MNLVERAVCGRYGGRSWCPLVALVFAFYTVAGNAANLHLAGPDATWERLAILTNSVTCEAWLDENEHSFNAVSEADSELALLPDWNAWRSLPEGRLDIWAEVVADGSNVVSMLFGTPEAPALTIACADDWSLHPAGSVPPDPPPPAAYGVVTQALHVAIYPGRNFGEGRSLVRSRNAAGVWRERPELALTSFGWVAEEQDISNWEQVGVALAGTEASLLSLLMRWAPDATIMILR